VVVREFDMVVGRGVYVCADVCVGAGSATAKTVWHWSSMATHCSSSPYIDRQCCTNVCVNVYTCW
jgi:hypothetical protein